MYIIPQHCQQKQVPLPYCVFFWEAGGKVSPPPQIIFTPGFSQIFLPSPPKRFSPFLPKQIRPPPPPQGHDVLIKITGP